MNRWHLQLIRSLTASVLADIEWTPHILDPAKVEETYNTNKAELERLETQLQAITGGINLASPKQLGVFLYETLGFSELTRKGQPERTESGAPKTDKATLLALKASNKKQREFLDLYYRYNKISETQSRYLNAFKVVCGQHDNKLFGELQQCRTVTHRLSGGSVTVMSSDGYEYNVQPQNIQRELKGLFTAPDGWFVGEADGCFTAGHKILLEDLSWKNVEDIRKGDILVGIEEEIRRLDNYRGLDRRMLPSIVEVTKVRKASCLKLGFSDGTFVTVSRGHPFLIRDKHNGAYRWETAEWILENSHKTITVRKLLDVSYRDSSLDYHYGKLAAYIDGEGNVAHDKIQIAQQDGSDILQDIENTLRAVGIPYTKKNYRMSEWSTRPVCSVVVTHMQNLFKIKQHVDPVKLRRNVRLLWEDKCPKGHNVQVVSIEDAGIQDVYSLQTSTKTYVGEGFFSHNCQLEFRVGAELGNDEVAKNDIRTKEDIHANTARAFIAAKDPAFTSIEDFKEARTKAKAQSFKPLFGGRGSDRFERAYVEFFNKRYSGVAGTQQKWCYDVLRAPDKGLRQPYGMMYYYPKAKMSSDGYIEQTTQIYNYSIQGFATAEIIPIALICFWLRADPERFTIVSTVHDSIKVWVREDSVEEFHKLSVQTFTYDVFHNLSTLYNYNFTTPLGCGVKCGRWWGSGEETSYDLDPLTNRLEIKVGKEWKTLNEASVQ